jgi:hypothetical protein
MMNKIMKERKTYLTMSTDKNKVTLSEMSEKNAYLVDRSLSNSHKKSLTYRMGRKALNCYGVL